MQEKRIPYGLTFDDVLLVPQKSAIVPSEVIVGTKLTKTLSLHIPIMSAAMDTVTEARLAIAIAREGGLGIIHKNMTIEQQAQNVDRVKRSEHGVITDPFYLSKDHLISDANELMARYRISGVPITQDGKLVGILTNRDLRFETDYTRKISRWVQRWSKRKKYLENTKSKNSRSLMKMSCCKVSSPSKTSKKRFSSHCPPKTQTADYSLARH